MKELDVYAWRGGVENFGDELGPAVLARLGYRVNRVEHIHEAGILSAGSLLETAAESAAPGTVIWGSGLMYGEAADLSHLDVRAVRGKLTARAAGLDVTLGDPGILVPRLWDLPDVCRGIGVVRHYADDRDYPWADAVMDAANPVDDVIEFIGSCEQVASSSLHGLIVATAWGIPAVRLPNENVAGGDFKWVDWVSGTGDPDGLLAALG